MSGSKSQFGKSKERGVSVQCANNDRNSHAEYVCVYNVNVSHYYCLINFVHGVENTVAIKSL